VIGRPPERSQSGSGLGLALVLGLGLGTGLGLGLGEIVLPEMAQKDGVQSYGGLLDLPHVELPTIKITHTDAGVVSVVVIGRISYTVELAVGPIIASCPTNFVRSVLLVPLIVLKDSQ